MASSLETNKILAALLTAGIFASGAGVVSRILYHPAAPEEPAYLIDVAAVAEEGGGAEAEAEVALASLLPSADVAAGQKGAKKCAACHTFEEGGKNKIGPNLWGVLGRDIGSVAGFGYSDALAELDGNWDFDGLDAFLAKPKDFAPGTKMAYAGMKNAGDRADLILYLRSLAADPMPLPEAEEQESAENVESETAEAIEEVAEATAETTEEAATVVADEASDAAEEVAETTEAAAEAASGAVEQVAETAEDAKEIVAAEIDEAAEAVDAAATTVVEATETATEAAGSTVEAADDQVAAATEAVTEAAGDAAEAASEQVAAVTDQAADMVEDATEQAAAMSEKATETVTGAAAAVTAAAGTTLAAVSGAADEAGSDVGGLVAMIASADVAAGEKVSKKCKACHVFDEGGKNKLGPALWGVVGRDIASHEGFKFSGALAELEGDWTYDRLDRFLAAPKTDVPGTKMVFAGVKKETDRANLIAYLRSLAAEPAPLADDG